MWTGWWASAKEVRGVSPWTCWYRDHALLVKAQQKGFWPPVLPYVSFMFYTYANYIPYKWSQSYKWGKQDLSWNLGICCSKQDTHFMLCPGKGPRSTYRYMHSTILLHPPQALPVNYCEVFLTNEGWRIYVTWAGRRQCWSSLNSLEPQVPSQSNLSIFWPLGSRLRSREFRSDWLTLLL